MPGHIGLGLFEQATSGLVQAIGEALALAIRHTAGVGDDPLDLLQAHLLQQPPRQARALGGQADVGDPGPGRGGFHDLLDGGGVALQHGLRQGRALGLGHVLFRRLALL